MLRFLTAGESHGPALVVVIEGIPAGLGLDVGAIDHQLWRRQQGYGRGQRMKIERDLVEVLAGVRRGETLGSPISLLIRNRDWKNWQRTMSVEAAPPPGAGGADRPAVTRPRPGHADLAGGIKYDRQDLRDVLERASARETAARVAAGAVARQLLGAVGVEVFSHVTRIGPVGDEGEAAVPIERVRQVSDDQPLRCADSALEARMVEAIDAARNAGDTLGGAFEVVAVGVPVGLGSHVQWDRKLDGRLAQALMSIPAIKAVGIGLGEDAGRRPGSAVHDEIVLEEPADGTSRAVSWTAPLARPTNRAGGLEGGITNGEPLRVSAVMKPIATLMQPLRSVDLATMQPSPAAIERSDVCAVPAAAVIGEAMVALVLADALLEKTGGDSLREVVASIDRERAHARARLGRTAPGRGE